MSRLKIRILCIILGVLVGWVAGTSTVYKFMNPSKTEMEAFLHIPKSFIFDFKEVNYDAD